MSDRPRGKQLVGKTIVSEEHGKNSRVEEDISFVADTGELMNLLITGTTQHIDDVALQGRQERQKYYPVLHSQKHRRLCNCFRRRHYLEFLMSESSEDYGGPIYGKELDAVMDGIQQDCDSYKASELFDADIVREDFGIGIYWDHENTERFVLVTAYDKNRAYISAGASSRDRTQNIIEIGFVDLEDLEPHLEAAGSTAESLDTPF